MGDYRILLTPKTAWADGTRHLLFAPLELLKKLAALTPRPRINLILYHGVLAPHARWRARVVAYGPLPGTAPMPPNPEEGAQAPPSSPRHWAWANLMRRAFGLDVLACPRCGGRLRLLGTIEDAAIRAILESLAASTERVDRAPPRIPVEPTTLATQV
jgi:Putative transposase